MYIEDIGVVRVGGFQCKFRSSDCCEPEEPGSLNLNAVVRMHSSRVILGYKQVFEKDPPLPFLTSSEFYTVPTTITDTILVCLSNRSAWLAMSFETSHEDLALSMS